MRIAVPGYERPLLLPDAYTLVVGAAPVDEPVVFIRDLCQGAHRVIAADGGADAVCLAGLMPTMIVGDLDSISNETLSSAQRAGVERRVVPTRKDFTDMQLALSVARDEGASDVVVARGVGGRLDHTLSVLGACVEMACLKPLLVGTHEVICILGASEGARRAISLSDLGVIPGSTFSVISYGGCVVDESGVAYPLTAGYLAPFCGQGVSNVMADDDAVVKCREGIALVVISH